MKFIFSLFLCSTLFANSPLNDTYVKQNDVLFKKSYSLIDFGAIGDGKADDSAAFIKAIEFISKTPSKTVIIPSNLIFNLNRNSIDFIKFQSGVILKFEGGILINGNLKGFNTKISANRIKIFENINLSGKFNSLSDYAYPEWYGIFPFDNTLDLVDALTKLDPVFFDIMLSSGDYFTNKGEYLVKGLKGTSMASTRIIMETDKSNTYLFRFGKVNGLLKDRTYDYNYIRDMSLYITKKNPKSRLKGNMGLIIGAVHKPFVENVKIVQAENYQRFTKTDLEQFNKSEKKISEANVGIEFRGDSELVHLANIYTLADIGILFSKYTDITYVNEYINDCGSFGIASVYVRKEAIKSQNLLFTGTQSWNQGLYGFYSEDSNEWAVLLNNKFENVRIEQLTKELQLDGKVVSTSIRIGKSNMIANPMFNNIILSGSSNGIYIGETPSGNVYFNNINLYPDITVKRQYAIKAKLLPPSKSEYETPLQIHLKNTDLYRDAESIFENSKSIINKSNNVDIPKNKFEDTVISY